MLYCETLEATPSKSPDALGHGVEDRDALVGGAAAAGGHAADDVGAVGVAAALEMPLEQRGAHREIEVARPGHVACRPAPGILATETVPRRLERLAPLHEPAVRLRAPGAVVERAHDAVGTANGLGTARACGGRIEERTLLHRVEIAHIDDVAHSPPAMVIPDHERLASGDGLP